MIANRYRLIVALAVGFSAAGAAQAQDSKSKDDAIDSLLEKLAAPAGETAKGKGTAKPAEKAKAQKPDAGSSVKGSKDGAGSKSSAGETGKNAGAGQAAKPAKPRSPGAGAVAPKDQAIDDLLEKLGEHKDTPTPEEHPGMPGGRQEPKDEPATRKAGAPKLSGKDKEIDDRLEELAGRRRRRRPADDEKRSGPVGEIIKEMRDVEQRLGKPDPSEDTQNKQKQIVKRIQTLIEEVSKSGSAGGRLVMRRNRRPGQQPGQDPGEREGAMAQGAPPMKPAKPASQRSAAGGRDVWGHLPPELRQIMENSFKETELSTKSEMIRRYFLSVAKGRPIREE